MNETLQQAIAAIKRGDKKAAQLMLIKVLRQDPRNEAAWLWMAEAVDEPGKKRECMERALAANPNSQAAKSGLEKLSRVAPPPSPPIQTLPHPSVVKVPPASVLTSSPAPPSDSKKCPYCAETIKAEAVVCRHCGRDLAARPTPQGKTTDAKSPKKWYRQQGFLMLTFLLFTPLWVLIVLTDHEQSTGVKVLAGILLGAYVLFICSQFR